MSLICVIQLMLPGESRIFCIAQDMLPGFHLYCTDPAQHLIAAGQDFDDLDRGIGVNIFFKKYIRSTKVYVFNTQLSRSRKAPKGRKHVRSFCVIPIFFFFMFHGIFCFLLSYDMEQKIFWYFSTVTVSVFLRLTCHLWIIPMGAYGIRTKGAPCTAPHDIRGKWVFYTT